MTDPQHDAGIQVRREVLGDDHVDRAIATTTPFSEPFQDFITRSAWGEVWAREELDRRTRSCITLALLAALRCESEIPMHVRAALRNGVTPAEIAAVLMHTTVYAGIPAAKAAFTQAQETLADDGVPEALPEGALSGDQAGSDIT